MISQLILRHRDQFVKMGLPAHLHYSVCEKIASQVFDAGSFFQFQDNDTASECTDDGHDDHNNVDDEDDDDNDVDEVSDSEKETEGLSNAVSTKYALCSTNFIKSEAVVLLIDHMWTTTFPQSRDQLKNIDGLCERVASMLGLEELEEDSDKNSSGSDARVTSDKECSVDCSAEVEGGRVDAVWRAVWPHLCCYVLPVDDYTRWFLMDEVGTAITHSNKPNMKCCPLLVSMPGSEPFALSLLWPVLDIQEGDVITRNYLPNVPIEDPSRKTRLLAFHSSILRSKRASAGGESKMGAGMGSGVPLKNVGDAETLNTDADCSTTHSITHSTTHSAHLLAVEAQWHAALSNIATHRHSPHTSPLSPTQPLKVFCDRSDHLNPTLLQPSARLSLVSSAAEADVLYLVDHTISASDESVTGGIETDEDREHDKKGKVSSQFCWNGMVVSKEHLARTMRTAYGTVPFLPVTYDLSYPDQLENFVCDFRERENSLRERSLSVPSYPSGEAAGEGKGCEGSATGTRTGCMAAGVGAGTGAGVGAGTDNIWILKRYRGRQSMDYPITDSLSCALRHIESAPRLACKYVSVPSLFKGRKYDLRFYVLVLSLEPLVLYRHKMFVIRAANHQYSVSDLEEYQKHFTVMNFLDDNSNSEDDSVRAIRGTGGRENPTSPQFIEIFNKEYGEKGKRENVGNSSCSTSSSSGGGGGGPASSCGEEEQSSSSSPPSSSTSSPDSDVWGDSVQPSIDRAIGDLFRGVSSAFSAEAPHPSGQTLHPNAGWSLNQPNVCPARAMYGVDVILTGDNTPLVLEVQWAPDCAQAVVQNKLFWNEILGGLFLEDFTNFEKL